MLAVVDADLDDVAPGTDPERAALHLALALARPGAGRDRLRGRSADQRAGRRRPRLARPAARRDPGPRQGPQGADRPARATRPGRRWRPTSRTAGRSCSSAAHDAVDAPPVEIFLNHLGGPLGVRGLRYRLDRLCVRAGPARSASRRTPCAIRSRRTCSTAARTCASSRSCSATRTSRRPRSTRTCRRVACRPPIGRPTRGRVATPLP